MIKEIIDVKYRDMFGINPKYERLINNRLIHEDCYKAFAILVNLALSNLVDLMKNNSSIKNSLPGWFKKKDTKNKYFEEYTPAYVSANSLNHCANLYAPGRLTKYVTSGLLGRVKLQPNQPYYYYIPYDFFTFNSFKIKIVPNDTERKNMFNFEF